MAKVGLHPRAKTSGFWLLILALILAVYAVTQIADAGKRPHDPRHPAPVATSAHPSATLLGDRTPVCQSPLQGHCWESEDDGDMPTMWRENPRAMMLSANLTADLASQYPGRNWSQCWQYVSRPVIECADGYVTELVP